MSENKSVFIPRAVLDYLQEEKLILGDHCIYSRNSEITGLNNNVIGVGGAGSGKTVSLLETALLETLRAKKLNRVVVCKKRHIVKKYLDRFREAGYRVYDLNLANPDEGNCMYDPLYYIKSEEDIVYLSRVIVETKTVDDFWNNSPEDLMCAVIALCMMTHDNATFADVLEMFRQLNISDSGSGITSTLDSLISEIERIDPDCFAVNCWRTFGVAAARTARSIYVSMNATLRAFTPDICNAMKKMEKINFKQFSTEKSILFITISPVNDALHSIASMLFNQAFKELFEIAEQQPYGKLPIPTDFAFDDIASGGQIPNLPAKLSIMREKAISMLLLCQSETQLEKMYGLCGSIEIIESCDSYVYMGGNNLRTAKTISEKADAILKEILNMMVGEEIVFRRGHHPVFTERYDIKHNKLFQKVNKLYERDLSCLKESTKE